MQYSYSTIGWFMIFTLGLFLFIKSKFNRQIHDVVEAAVAQFVAPTKSQREFGTMPSLTRTSNGSLTKLVHRLCPHNNVVQSFEVEQKDSLDDHLDSLAKKLAEKEGKLLISKTKIRQTQNEIDNLHAIDYDVRSKYKDIMETLRSELQTNEKDCKAMQQQIEWVSKRRAELQEEVVQTQREFGEFQAELTAIKGNKLENLRCAEQPWHTTRRLNHSYQGQSHLRSGGSTSPLMKDSTHRY